MAAAATAASDAPAREKHWPARHFWALLYLASLFLAGAWLALLNAPSGYAPVLCGSAYRNVPCLTYSWLDSWPQWVGAALWFTPVACNIACLVLLIYRGRSRDLAATLVALVGVVGVGAVIVLTVHWHVVVRDLGVAIDDTALHRWNLVGLVHYAFEYALIPLAAIAIPVLAITLTTRSLQQRRGVRAADSAKS